MSTAELALDVRERRGAFELAAHAGIQPHGVSVVFGPNGAGKSLLLRVIAGLEPGAQGVVRFGDDVWQDSTRGAFVAPHKRPVAMVFQDARLFAHLDVAGNLGYAESRAWTDGPQIGREDVVEAFDIRHLLSRSITGLSGGERQRVCMARALLTRRRLILMDEPLAALDVHARARALGFIEQIPQVFGVPVIYVTHQIDEVVRLADHLVLMGDGKIEAQGPAADLLSRLDLPPFTGRFEASVLLEARVVGNDEHFALTTLELGDGVRIELPALDFAAGDVVRLRIRARDVILARKVPEAISVRNVVPVTVDEVAEEPGTAYAEVRLTCAGQALRARVTRASVKSLDVRPGADMHALVKATALDRRLLARR